MKYRDPSSSRPLSSMTPRDMERASARSFTRDFNASRHNMDARCSECRGRGCDYCLSAVSAHNSETGA